ncbi:MAG TPA: polysaccharide biosynthesis/export family protein [Bryobacteraceae bacterium]|nr:polysaccharide biosynthesis/export family protein [Bryobacteraceae bacterium]
MQKFFVLIVFGLAFAVSGWSQEKPKTQGEGKTASLPTELPAADSPSAPVDPKAYRIGPEDVIAIRVWREPDMSGQFVVRPDGRITLPLAGELQVSDLSPEQVQAKVVEMYSKYINKPEVGVSLARVGSKKYYLVGQVLKAGTFPLVVPTTVLEAINSAGGFQEFANKKKIIILRGAKRIPFNYDEVIKGKKVEQNILVESGDHIIVR